MLSRLKIIIGGAVQGVGFRPFVFNLAGKLSLRGFVLNSAFGVEIEVEGNKSEIENFLILLQKEKPPLAYIGSLESIWLDPVGYTDFEIRESIGSQEISAFILPDIAVCPECLKEMFDPADRRYEYPFINCTNCGPRYSIIEKMPYDRPNTSMKEFEMCDECRKEYENQTDRRFHAQPVACPNCGPYVFLTDSEGKKIAIESEAISNTVKLLKAGKIIALKGLGGFQLLADPFNSETVAELRKRKNREEKPFALMTPTLNYLANYCRVDKLEARVLASPESPIVFLRRKKTIKVQPVDSMVAPDNPYLGVMLPYSPLHHLLIKRLGQFVIATSGNISEEPMCTDNDEALNKLGGIADYFLMHNRPIVRAVDDSIVRLVGGKELVLRRARGYAPLPVSIPSVTNDSNAPVLAVGGHLKSSIALAFSNNVFISQHIGDLSTSDSFRAFKKTINDLVGIFGQPPGIVVHDLHPEYLSTKFAKSMNIEKRAIQHHLAHAVSCKAENHLHGETLAVSWDGTGFGLDNTIWGGEFFLLDDEKFAHAAQFRKFPLPGGEKAIREPRRALFGLLFEMHREKAAELTFVRRNFEERELSLIRTALSKNINSPLTSSAGRLFDAAASLLNIVQINNYEGEAGMMLEFTAQSDSAEAYPFKIRNGEPLSIDWSGIFTGMIEDLENSDSGVISKKFHNTLAEIILKTVEYFNIERVLLTGGCFQNMVLTETASEKLINNGYKVYTHQRVPPNDGGIALGQAAGYFLKRKEVNSFNFKSKEVADVFSGTG